MIAVPDIQQLVLYSVQAPPPCPTLSALATCPAGQTSIAGKVSYDEGTHRPVGNALVKLHDEASNDDCLAQTHTDDRGHYLFCRSEPSGTDLSVTVLTTGPYAQAALCVRDEQTAGDCDQLAQNSGDVFAIRSTPFDHGAGAQIQIDLPEGDQWNMDAARALGVYEAVNLAQKSVEPYRDRAGYTKRAGSVR